ncbi:hypothetical protein PENTCL1PPCAC_10039, partial [Pristionchus entomophagus]
YFSYNRRARFLLPTTIILFLSTLLSNIFSDISPMIVAPSQSSFLAFVCPFLSVCFAQTDRMHLVVAYVIVLPSVTVATFVISLGSGARYTLLAPTGIFIIFKYVVHVGSSFNGNLMLRKWDSFLLRSSGVAFIVGFVAAACAMAVNRPDLRRVFDYITAGGGLALNVVLVASKIQSSKIITVKKTGRFIVLKMIDLLALLSLICVNILGIYLCLEFCRALVFISTILLYCLYLSLVYLHDPLRVVTPNWLYFVLIVGTLAAMLCSDYLNVPQFSQLSGSNTSHPLFYRSSEQDDTLADALSNNALLLMFSYFMFSALGKDNEKAKFVEYITDMRLEEEDQMKPSYSAPKPTHLDSISAATKASHNQPREPDQIRI